jgi:hypothetical protein
LLQPRQYNQAQFGILHVLDFLFTPKSDFIELAVVLGFVKESVEYLQCHLCVFLLLVVEEVECSMQCL